MTRKLIIIGAGGAGCDALWVTQRIKAATPDTNWTVLGWVDEDPSRKGERVEELPILGTPADVCQEFSGADIFFHCAIGHNFHRQRVVGVFERAGFEAATLIDPSAVVAASAKIAPGTYVGPLVTIASRAHLGRHVLVNYNASVGHHAQCGDFSQICPGARISGHSRLGEGTFIGSNGVVAPKVSVAEWARVGANSFARHDVASQVTAVGVPARPIAAARTPARA
jgi:sugar O-acyltransferase (sialic acid O-acetyltransferase NeuD family)